MGVHSIRLGQDDERLEKVLSLQGKNKSEYIKNALYFYLDYKDKFNNIDKNIETINRNISTMESNIQLLLDKLKSGIPETETREEEQISATLSDVQQAIFDSISEIMQLSDKNKGGIV